jgi:hypothetical protein
VEIAACYVVSEALANTAKQASATVAGVEVAACRQLTDQQQVDIW